MESLSKLQSLQRRGKQVNVVNFPKDWCYTGQLCSDNINSFCYYHIVTASTTSLLLLCDINCIYWLDFKHYRASNLMQQLIENAISVTCTGFTIQAVLVPVTIHTQNNRKYKQMDGASRCAYSAGLLEGFLTDNQDQLPSWTETEKQRLSDPICLSLSV